MKPDYAMASPEEPLGRIFRATGKKAGHGHASSLGESGAGEDTGPSFSDAVAFACPTNEQAHLSLYVHTPFCRHRCLFCPFYKNRATAGFSERYRKLLEEEIRLTAELHGEEGTSRPVSALYFGGGTPSDMEGTDLAAVMQLLGRRYALGADTEVTVEGRLRGFGGDKARQWVEAGANRFSVGLQSTDTRLRRRLGRVADRKEMVATLNALSATGALVIVDLLYGLPGQSPSDLQEDIRFLATETAVDGLDLYALKVFPGSPLETAVNQGSLPPLPCAEERAEAFLWADAELSRQGFSAFTPMHWRRTERERSLYNKLAAEKVDMVPFGSGAGGRLGGYSLLQHGDLTTYARAIQEGHKPCLVMLNPETPQSRFRQFLAAELNRMTVPHWQTWGQPPERAAALAENWLAAGLMEADSGKTRDGYGLTVRGAFWHEHMRDALADAFGHNA